MEITRPLGTYGFAYGWMYLLTALSAAVFAWGAWRRLRRWRRGQGRLADRLDRPGRRLGQLLADLATQRRLRAPGAPWLFHLLLLWGFSLFLLATVCLMLQEDFGLPTFAGPWYLALSLGLDLFALLVPAAVLVAAWRRWRVRPESLDRHREDGVVLLLVALLPVSGLILEALRLAAQPDPWAAWSPVGNWLAAFLAGADPQSLWAWHQRLWWGHLLLSLGFLASLPFTRLSHLLTGPAALFLADRQPGRLPLLDFTDETAESFGAGRPEELHWKCLLDADACLGCGRCQDQCPAWRSGKPLSPKQVGQTIRDRLRGGQEGLEYASLAGEIGEEALWACTTCRACESSCPIAVEHLPRTVELRRHLVLTQARFPAELKAAFRGLETAGNPWNFPRRERDRWRTGQHLPLLAEMPDCPTLLWPGCAAAYDPGARAAVVALAGLLQQAGVPFALLGPQEVCCGDAARRLGNEYLFQELAQQNIAALSRHAVRTIITACPHCFHTLGNDYPLLGGRWEVLHHSVVLHRLLQQGRLQAENGVPRTTVYHDSCYLARYHDIRREPRAALTAAGLSPAELPRHGREAFCCGGGGGRMWLEERGGTPIRGERVQEIIASGAAQVATACPFCRNMLADGLREAGRSDTVRVADIAEILAGACRLDEAPPSGRIS